MKGRRPARKITRDSALPTVIEPRLPITEGAVLRPPREGKTGLPDENALAQYKCLLRVRLCVGRRAWGERIEPGKTRGLLQVGGGWGIAVYYEHQAAGFSDIHSGANFRARAGRRTLIKARETLASAIHRKS